jgi:protein-tyrosine sulfotransferase
MPVSYVIQSFLANPKKIFKNLRWRFPTSISSERHVFVVGAPRSGTTLVQSILSVHPQLIGLDEETGFFTFRDLFCLNLSGLDSHKIIEAQERAKDIIDYFDRIASLITNGNVGSRFLEKTPQHVLRLGFLLNYFPNSQVIHIVRDGRDCFCSAKGHPGVVQGGNVGDYAKYWKRCIRSRMKYASDSVIDIKYEDLTVAPRGEMQKVMEFLGLELLDDQLDPAFYSINKMSGKNEFKMLNKPISPSNNGRWKADMSNEEKERFLRIARQELEAFGYPTGE